MEKGTPTLPVAAVPAQPTPVKRHSLRLGVIGLLAILYLAFRLHTGLAFRGGDHSPEALDWCPLLDAIEPEADGLKSSFHLMRKEQLDLQVERLSAAVQVPTESFDNSGAVGEDPHWAIFDDFHAVLRDHFPLVHAHFELQKVNTYGLLFTLHGSEPSLKPILFMAHQDVVPADASAPWTHPPFSGHYDGTWVWGRGAGDCKNVLIGVLSVLEDLLAQSFAPRRTIVLSFGFDEEVSGARGAGELSKALEAIWGPDSIVLIIDEGGMGIQSIGDDDSGVLLASPGVGEKGYVDIQLTVTATGGHSSKPPPHTGIGILADVIHALEAHPYTPLLQQSSPFRRVLECRARYVPSAVPSWLGSALLHDDEADVAQRLVAAGEGVGGALEEGEQWLMQTSQAADVITGGIKVNALPEKVQVLVNYRIALHQSIETVLERVRAVLAPVVQQHGLTFVYGAQKTAAAAAAVPALELTTAGTLDVAPLSPTDNHVWARFAGTLRSVFETTESGRNKTVVPVGSTMTGNTDTRYYWALSRNIYRFAPSRDGTRLNAHAIDERMEMTAHLEGMRFYYDLIRNFDHWDEE